MNNGLIFGALGAGLIALVFAWWKTQWINRQDPGTPRMLDIGAAVREGAMAFLKREYKVLSLVVVIVAILLAAINTGPVRLVSWRLCSAPLFGAVGFVRHAVATAANMRTTNAARRGCRRPCRWRSPAER